MPEMSEKPEAPTPRRRPPRESAVQSNLDYVLKRMAEMRDKDARDARYRPGFQVHPPGSDEKE